MNRKLALLAPAPFPAAGAALLPLALLAGCASPSGDYPSLAIRDAERIAGTLEPADPQPYVPPAPSAATLGQAEALVEAAETANEAFLAEAPGASSIVENARGTATGSDARARAEVALAGLIAARSVTMQPLADLDRLYVDAATQGEEIARIAAAREAVEEQVAAQNAAIDRLQQVLAQ